MAVYAPCADCGGELIVGVFHPIAVPKLDEEGTVVRGRSGEPETVRLRLPAHRCEVGASKFDPTGLAPAPCRHGLAEHPDPEVMASPHARQAVSWMRAKHVGIKRHKNGLPLAGCPVCFEEPRPADLCEAADGTPTGELLIHKMDRLAGR